MEKKRNIESYNEGYKKALKSGYLLENYRLFHLRDNQLHELEYHYHDFSKIVIMLSGKATYMLEGRAYTLNPWDILLVNRYEIHKPIVDTSMVYERIVIWVKNEYLESLSNSDCDLQKCFLDAQETNVNLIKLVGEDRERIQKVLMDMEEAKFSLGFGSSLLSDALFTQFMVLLNRQFIKWDKKLTDKQVKYDKQILEIIEYINNNLGNDLSNESLAERFYLSKYYLMHKFKEETGYTLHNYIVQKRLINAVELIKQGMPIIKATENSGFNEYSSFLRAYKKRYNASPKDIKTL